MNEKKSVKVNGGLIRDVMNYARLVVRLMADARISPLLKLLPVGALVYLINPFDFPFILDDAAVLGLGIFSFIELCPKDIVEEHMALLNRTVSGSAQDAPPPAAAPKEDVIDAEFRDTDSKP